MATRSAILYQGEDMSPALDYTDFVIWEESEFGTRAWQGEGSESTIVIRDPLGEQGSGQDLPSGLTAKSLASKNLFVVDLDGAYMFRGRIGVKNYSRDDQRVERYRQVECSLHDTNWDLDHIFVNAYSRPAETDNARIQGIIASYLSGSPRATTVLNGSNFLSGSNTVNLAAQEFNRTSPLAMIREISTTTNKQFFVTGDAIGGGSLFWDGNDSTVYPAGMKISDRLEEADDSCTGFEPLHIEGHGLAFEDENVSIVFGTDVDGSADTMLIALIATDTSQIGEQVNQVVWEPNGQHDVNPGIFTRVQNSLSSEGWEVWTLINPDAGVDATARIYIDTNNLTYIAGVAYISGVDTSDPIRNMAVASGTGTSSSVSIDTESGDLVVDIGGWFENNATPATPTPGGTQTEINTDLQNASFGQRDSSMGFSYQTASTTSTSATWAFGASHPWWAVAVAIKGGSGSANCVFPPIWNVGPASTEDGSEQLCEVVLYYGTNADQYVTTHNLTVHNLYGHASATFTDDADISAATALLRARAILAHRQYEDKTYNVTVGPLTDDQVLLVKHGHTIQIKARAIPDADDQYRTMRVVQCRYTTPVPGTWFVHLQLGRPWKLEPYGSGPTLVPTTAGELTIADAGGYFTGTTIEAALQEIGAGSVGDVSTVTDHGSMGATETFDFADGSDHEGTQDANLTVTLTGATAGEAAFMTLVLTQDATGARTLTLPASVVTRATVEADWDTTANAVNVLNLFSYDGGTTWYGFLAGSGTAATTTAWIVDPGTPSYSGTGPVTVALTSVFGIDSSGNPYYNAANVTDGEEAALVWDSDTGTYLLRPYYP